MEFAKDDLVVVDTSKRGALKIHGKVGRVVSDCSRVYASGSRLFVVEIEGSRYGMFADELTKVPEELDQNKLSEKAFNELGLIWDELGPNERAVLLTLANRLFAGQSRYGKLEPNKKDWKKEAYEEALDMSVYAACLFLQESPND